MNHLLYQQYKRVAVVFNVWTALCGDPIRQTDTSLVLLHAEEEGVRLAILVLCLRCGASPVKAVGGGADSLFFFFFFYFFFPRAPSLIHSLGRG